jgi:hypothetical protein
MKCLTSFLLLFVLTSAVAQPVKEKDFSATVKAVVTALKHRDSAALLKYTDEKWGVYIIHRPGILDTYKNYPQLSFSDTTYPNVPFYDNVVLTTIRYASLPTYDCEAWSKTGTFVDTLKRDHLLSGVAKNLAKQIKGSVPAKTIKALHELEMASRRIVIASRNGADLIFYLSLLNNKWVLTIIDKISNDCSL